jgi:ornithine decarboxylase antizyme 1
MRHQIMYALVSHLVVVKTLQVSVPTLPLPLLRCRPNHTAFRWVWGRCGGPDVLSLRSDHDRASLSSECNRKKSIDSISSSEYSNADDQLSVVDEGCEDGVEDDQASFNLENHEDSSDLIAKILSQKVPTRITLKLHITENTFSIWETVLNNVNNVLYVAIPTTINHEASKHSFISLLEFAEEKLNAAAVVLCMRKDRTDRASLVRTFLFLGFQPLDPRSPLAPPKAAANKNKSIATDDNLYLICDLRD